MASDPSATNGGSASNQFDADDDGWLDLPRLFPNRNPGEPVTLIPGRCGYSIQIVGTRWRYIRVSEQP